VDEKGQFGRKVDKGKEGVKTGRSKGGCIQSENIRKNSWDSVELYLTSSL